MKKILLLIILLFSTQVVFAKVKSNPAINSGYVGTLPNVLEQFQAAQQKKSPQVFESVDGFNDQTQIKPVPRNNPAFVNIILKKDKTSQYVKDINEIILIVQKIEKSLEDKEDTQKFNAVSNYLNENVEFLRDKYKNKSEGSYISFRKLMQLNTHVQTVSQLRAESSIYSPYLPYTDKGYIYSPNNINKQMDYLLKEVEDTLVILQEAK